MSTYKTAAIATSLVRKGFTVDQTHHEMYWYYDGERKTGIRTRLSHSLKEYGDVLLGQVGKQLKLDRAGLSRFVECPMTAEEYRAHLRRDGHLPPATPADR